MAAGIILGRLVKATVAGWEWECDDPVILAALKMITPEDGPGGEVANPDKWLAEHACRILGGELLWSDPAEGIPGAVY